jgi:hypothetical protein
MKTSCLLLFLLLAIAYPASGAPLDQKIQAFNDALKASNPTGTMPYGRVMPFLDPSTYPSGDSGLESMVQQMMSSSSSAAVQKAGEDLLTAIRDERKARLDSISAKVDAVLSSLPDIVAKADKTSDLDAVLADIQGAMPAGSMYGGNGEEQTQINRVNAAYQFVSQWQDYLSESAAGNKQEALNTLRNLSQQRPPGPPIVPRSTILDRIIALEPQVNPNPGFPQPQGPVAPVVGPIIDGIKTLDDLGPAAQHAQEVTGNAFGNPDAASSARLQQMASRYAEAKNGLPVSLNFTPLNSGAQAAPEFARVDAMLLAYLLPRFLGTGAPPENADETVDAYLDQVTATAIPARNWPLLQRTVLARVQIAGAQPQETQEFLTALNQELAGQYALAVVSYESALRAASRFIPATFIGERLAALQKDHPAEYAEGLKNAAHPPTPSFYPVLNPYASRYGMPGYPVFSINPPAVSTPAPPPAPAKVPDPAPVAPSKTGPAGKTTTD